MNPYSHSTKVLESELSSSPVDQTVTSLNDHFERNPSAGRGTASLRSRRYTPSPSPHPLNDSSTSSSDEEDVEMYSLFRK